MSKRDPLAAGAVLLAVTAFAGSFTHVQATVALHGQHGWISWAIALMPEVMVWLAVLRIRVVHRDPWSWVTLVSAGAFTVAANLAQAEPSPWGWVVAGWPAWAAISSAGMLKMGGPRPVQKRVKPQVSGPVAPVQAPVQRPAPLQSVKAAAGPVVDRSERVKELRAKRVTWSAIAAELGVSVSTAKRLAA